MVNATARRTDDVIVAGKICDEEMFRCGSFGLASAVGHGLAAAGLIEWIIHIEIETFQKLERCYPNLWKKRIDIARHE